ncbi:hypothetical protein GGX14DRAFT_701143 [Mycena pura]|uniref:F-box domain-containing protein n=1 Tax=Mycena pura TaxID=153505 RepID=A0AAD6UTQ9_9AGAR|nr:hypothetical protein GGX14DRAFT_701143 [Mycena pura]
MATQLAQELLVTIVGHVHDKPTLKSCALTSSRLHTLSQRGLFSSFRISLASPSRAPTTSYKVVNRRFLQSPRLAGYVTTLTVGFPFGLSAIATAADVRALRLLLGQLKRVRQFTLESENYFVWSISPVEISLCAPILDFIRRMNLLQLHIRSIRHIPLATLAAFFCAAQTLGIHNAAVHWAPQDITAALPRARVEHLRLTDCDSVVAKLRRHQFAPLAANVRRMWITMRTDYPTFQFGHDLARRLEYLRVEWPLLRLLERPMDPIQPLVALRTLDLSYRFFDRDVEPSSVAILEPLFSCTTAALAEVRFAYTLGENDFGQHYFHVDTLAAAAAALDKCPGAHSDAPRIRWYLSVEGMRARKEHHLVQFTASLQAGLPHIHEQGRLYVQNRAFTDDWGD